MTNTCEVRLSRDGTPFASYLYTRGTNNMVSDATDAYTLTLLEFREALDIQGHCYELVENRQNPPRTGLRDFRYELESKGKDIEVTVRMGQNNAVMKYEWDHDAGTVSVSRRQALDLRWCEYELLLALQRDFLEMVNRTA